jgi:hypothetical protein
LSDQSIERELLENLDQPERGTHPLTKGRPSGVRNKPDSWKNVAAPAWKLPPSLKLAVDPDSIAYRTRLCSQHALDQEGADLVHSIEVDTRRSNENQQNEPNSPSGIQENWLLCNRRTFLPRLNSIEPFKPQRDSKKRHANN